MGSRMLKSMIENPLIDREKINQRYDTVETLLREFILKEDLNQALFEVLRFRKIKWSRRFW